MGIISSDSKLDHCYHLEGTNIILYIQENDNWEGKLNVLSDQINFFKKIRENSIIFNNNCITYSGKTYLYTCYGNIIKSYENRSKLENHHLQEIKFLRNLKFNWS